MRAALCREIGELGGVTVGEIDPPTAGKGQVVIDVQACAVNFPDVLMVRGMYQERPPLPFAPGQEVAGVVERDRRGRRGHRRRRPGVRRVRGRRDGRAGRHPRRLGLPAAGRRRLRHRVGVPDHLRHVVVRARRARAS